MLKKEFISLTMVAMEKEKNFTHHSNDCSEQKMFHQKLESYRFRLPLKKFD